MDPKAKQRLERNLLISIITLTLILITTVFFSDSIYLPSWLFYLVTIGCFWLVIIIVACLIALNLSRKNEL